ncbi:hypothetical protein L13192_08810 [Pyrenophora tritici-repentis]|nr:hypothetical protein L13192_08810 [Pyrenophora tritici-repentis]
MAQLLEKTTEICKQVKLLLSNFNESTSDSDSSDSSDSDASGDDIINSGMNSVVEDVRNYTGCLLDLSAAFECPANDIEKEVASSIVNVEERAAHDYHAQLLQAKFPSAQTELIHRLGETSWNRYQRMVQERESNANAQIQVEVCIYQSKESRSFKAASEFQDSGLGTSLPSAPSISYAETIISFMTSIGGGERVHIPPLSIEAKSGARFECNACGKQIQATTNRDWRKHLFADLQPYTCFYANCSWSTTPFVDRQLWSRHLELDHELGPAWNTFECPLCLEMTEPGKSAILIHFARHMEDIALAALPRDVESDAESDSLSECTTSTFGNRIEAPEDALRETSSNVKDTNKYHPTVGSIGMLDITPDLLQDPTMNRGFAYVRSSVAHLTYV